ncbi:MAG: DNA repair protein RadC [Candidatus Thiodiazotropha sp. (ex Epidulcina cf. delphinae)]|nr:DNA repair protein RadC [Candidatus Thiodiazotropha sp. (ex Epidulcina cf. delphinae)]
MAYIKELKLTYERKRVEDDLLNTPVESASHVYDLFMDMQNDAREKIVCLHLNPRLEILSFEVIAMGTDHYVISDPIEVFRSAIIVRASKIVVVHNHPLGSSRPSQTDIEGANRIRELGELHRIRLIDFIVIGDDGYFSLDENGLLSEGT